MNHVILYAHPYDGSYNYAILESVTDGLKENNNNNVRVIDLNKEKFDPVLNVKDLEAYNKSTVVDEKIIEYQKFISEADHLIIIFPIWFESMPAILKGFFDRVFSKGFAYEYVNGMPKPLLRGKTATVISTLGAPTFYYDLFMNNPLEGELNKGILKFSGFKLNRWYKLGNIQNVSDGKRKKWLKDIKKYCQEIGVR